MPRTASTQPQQRSWSSVGSCCTQSVAAKAMELHCAAMAVCTRGCGDHMPCMLLAPRMTAYQNYVRPGSVRRPASATVLQSRMNWYSTNAILDFRGSCWTPRQPKPPGPDKTTAALPAAHVVTEARWSQDPSRLHVVRSAMHAHTRTHAARC
jgi:hypothetical protein